MSRLMKRQIKRKYSRWIYVGLFLFLFLGFGADLLEAQTTVSENTLVVEWVEGKASVLDPVQGIWVELKKEMEVPEKARVRTEENSRVILKSSFSSIQIEPKSELEVQKLLREWSKTQFLLIRSNTPRWDQQFTLIEGEVYIQVKPKKKKSRFLIETETAVMAVRGTFFKVKRFPDLNVDVWLRDGELFVQNKIKLSELILPAGNSLKVDPAVFLERRHIQPLSPIQKQQLEGPKKKLAPLVAAKGETPGAAEGIDVQEGETAGVSEGPYERDRLVSWRQNYFFLQNGRHVGEVATEDQTQDENVALQKEWSQKSVSKMSPALKSQITTARKDQKKVTHFKPIKPGKFGLGTSRQTTQIQGVPTADSDDSGRFRGKNVAQKGGGVTTKGQGAQGQSQVATATSVSQGKRDTTPAANRSKQTNQTTTPQQPPSNGNQPPVGAGPNRNNPTAGN